MGQIGRFIDAACRAKPEVMQTVVEREMGNLGSWVYGPGAGYPDSFRGCLIGSVAIARVLNNPRIKRSRLTEYMHSEAIIAADVGRMLGMKPRDILKIGIQVPDVAERLHRDHRAKCIYDSVYEDYCPDCWSGEKRTIEMFKGRIRRTLAAVMAARADAAITDALVAASAVVQPTGVKEESGAWAS